MASLDEISVAIGELRANVEHLSSAVEQMKNLPADVREIKASVEAMQPTVEEVRKWKQRAIGVSAVVSAIITIVSTSLFTKIREWIG